MGAAQSYVSPEAAATAVAIAGAIGLGYTQVTKSDGSPRETPEEPTGKKGKKKKGSKQTSGDLSTLPEKSETGERPAQSLNVIPGQFEPSPIPTPHEVSAAENSQSKAKKQKKKKSKVTASGETQSLESSVDQLPPKAGASKSKSAKRASQKSTSRQDSDTNLSATQTGQPLHVSTISIDTDDSWTRVGPKRQGGSVSQVSGSNLASAEPITSDAGASTSYTGNSSAAERTDDEAPNSFLLQQSASQSSRSLNDPNRKTLAEKLLPTPRKTGVDDMLETSDYPSLSRVMRVAPLQSEQPAAGFSWGDYEDVRVTTDGGENDADGEDDGWGVVTSKRPKRSNAAPSTSQPSLSVQNSTESLTKRQRQNAQKREKQKGAKADAEAERLAILAKHKRELEKARIAEQSSKSGGKTTSGGMKATIDDRGKLIWE